MSHDHCCSITGTIIYGKLYVANITQQKLTHEKECSEMGAPVNPSYCSL